MSKCPICLSIDHFPYKDGGTWGLNNMRHECDVCGVFGTTWEARDDYLPEDRARTTRVVRAALSHWIRLRQDARGSDSIPVVAGDLVESAIEGEFRIPNPAELALNIIRYIGTAELETGEAISTLPPSFHASVGAVRRDGAYKMLLELAERGQLHANDASSLSMRDASDVRLTLDGWQSFEAERKGQESGNYGFIALKFGDPVLDPFLRDHIKPAVESMGIQLRDMRDCSRAGIIDNLMRIEIRDSAFVLVDLTHDNSGAYWEAGYAEGLGKPVLYLCEKSKFDSVKTHFDTNHCTTIPWDIESPEDFADQLVATLKRSIII